MDAIQANIFHLPKSRLLRTRRDASKPAIIVRTMSAHKTNGGEPALGFSLLLIGVPSPAVIRKQQVLHDSGFVVTRADNICTAELLSEAQYFDAAVYDESLPETEQVSLARVMHVRWPWMRLVRFGYSALKLAGDEIFDATTASEATLPAIVLGCLST